MEDGKIVQLYWDRDERAIPATAEKYGGYCTSIARNILGSRDDAEECVNDTYLRAWNAMPPHRPEVLPAFLGKLVRNVSLDRCRRNAAGKRGGGELPAVLGELSEVVSGTEDVGQTLERRELLNAINDFLTLLPPEKRGIFVRRYWYTESISKIASRYGMKDGAVSMALGRLRAGLRSYLTERGFEL